MLDFCGRPEKCNVAGTIRGRCCMETKGDSSLLIATFCLQKDPTKEITVFTHETTVKSSQLSLLRTLPSP